MNYCISTDTLVVISMVDCGEFNKAVGLTAVDFFKPLGPDKLKSKFRHILRQ